MPPLLEDDLFYYEDTLAAWVIEGERIEITLGGILGKPSIAASEEVDQGVHRGHNSRDREVAKSSTTLLMDMGNNRVILDSQSIRKRQRCPYEEVEGVYNRDTTREGRASETIKVAPIERKGPVSPPSLLKSCGF